MKHAIWAAAGAVTGIAMTIAAAYAAIGDRGVSAVNADQCEAVHEIVITYKFNPDEVQLEEGDCIYWKNGHIIEHSAVGLDREFNTGVLMPGGTAVRRFDEAGAFPYICGVHPPMVAVLVVKPRD